MSYNESEYLDIYIEETIENTEQLDILLISLEKNNGRKDILKSIYQAVHTVKGSSSSLKFTGLSALMHTVETLLDKIIKDTLHLTPQVVESLFHVNDVIKASVSDIRQGLDFQTDFEAEQKRIEALDHDGGDSSGTPKQEVDNNEKIREFRFEFTRHKEEILQAREANAAFYILTFLINREEELKDSRRRILFRRIEESGTVLDYVPRRKGDYFTGSDLLVKCLFAGTMGKEQIEQINKIDRIREFRFEEIPFSNIKFEEEVSPIDKALLFEENTIKVKIEKLDKLLNHAQELTIINLAFNNILKELKKDKQYDSLKYLFSETHDKLTKLSSGLHRQIMQTRMVPVGYLFKRYYRMVRDLAGTLKKKVTLMVTGAEEEIDKNTIDLLYEPLLHLIRNILDHGIESPEEREKAGKDPQAKIRINAFKRSNRIIIELSDDGRGIDTEKIKNKAIQAGLIPPGNKMSTDEILELIFLPNFSTKSEVDELGGRGMGMNIVRERINSLYGDIRLETEVKKGTSFIISLPTTLSILPALIVKDDGKRFAVPFIDIDKIIHVRNTDIKWVDQRPVILLESIVPIIKLTDYFNKKYSETEVQKAMVLIIDTDKTRFGIMVDEVIGKYDIVTKSLDFSFLNIHGIKSVTILGDGKVVPIIDAGNIACQFNSQADGKNRDYEYSRTTGGESKMEKTYEIM